MLTGLLSGLVMPKIDRACDEYGAEEKGYGIWTILKIPSVALVALSIASTSMSLGFVSATLEPHIRSVRSRISRSLFSSNELHETV